MSTMFTYEPYNVQKMAKRVHKNWIVQQGLSGNDDIDVMPIDDLHEHIPGSNCPCKPIIEVVGAILIITHNSYDHREIVEQAEELLCIKS